jgi:myo-inositol catabolism protein IolS
MNNPRLILGTEVFSGSWGINYSEKEVRKILEFALVNGVNEIDTASSYGDNHFVEKLLGDVICLNRKDYIIASKFYLNHFGKNKGKPIQTISDIEKDFSETLKSLKTNYIDIYYFHSGLDNFFFQDHIWYFLNDLVRQGAIKKLGLSLNHSLVKSGSNEQLKNAKKYGISVIQTVLNLLSRESLDYVIPFSKSQNFDIYGRMPLAKGLLSGKYSTSTIFAENDPRRKNETMTKELLNRIENEENISIQHAIKWALENCQRIVIGSKNIKQLDETIKASIN